jgi:methyltransferase-like protein/SAM-dependent methyltransferase
MATRPDQEITEKSYEAVPYPDLCYAQTHPDRLATIGTLLGLEPTPIDRCRILELGCAAGGNLLPMAYQLPNSDFVGIDFSAVQIEAGNRSVAALGLTNVTLLQRDILDLDAEIGRFDYIIAHGVYSWTPDPVRIKLLELCRDLLTPNGITFISYNTLPGWHNMLAMREIMQYHTRNIDDPLERATAAHDLIDTMAELTPEDQAHGHFVRSYQRLTANRTHSRASKALLLHDELEEINQPFYFHEFAARLANYDLQYLAEAEFPTVVLSNLGSDNAQKLLQLAGNDLIALEQYMDFVRNRTLRQTLVCHADTPIKRTLTADPAQMRQFSVTTRARLASETIDLQAGVPLVFHSAENQHITVDHPTSKAALLLLISMSPQAIPFDVLLDAARERLAAEEMALPDREDDARALSTTLLRGFTTSLALIELHIWNPPFALQAGERPYASRIARFQAAAGYEQVASLRHERVSIDPFVRLVLPFLDGQHSVDAVVDQVVKQIKAGALTVKSAETTPSRDAIASDVQSVLRWLGRVALLEQ